ncbi:hypothetical protein C0039_10195 [Pseudohalioglobus lutimaris]|uniref:Uncharacterized protein n=1 Tax=Pseudohalioglobus lutimaris TaxID=1737061 RepID=A0A2N5X3A9_9GAMM|nr:hypothetical protein C0039_10195 [Pseudohalioglobus lutimaris]
MLFAYSNIYIPIMAYILIALSSKALYSSGSRLAGLIVGASSGALAFASLMAEIWGEWPKQIVYGPQGEFLWFGGQPNAWHEVLGYLWAPCLLLMAIGLCVHARRIATLNK